MKKEFFVGLLVVFCCTKSQTEEDWFDTSQNLTYGYPIYSDTLLNKDYFVVASNRNLKIPDWVAYHLTSSNLQGDTERTNDFRVDAEIQQGDQALLKDYRGSGYDRGHMAPAASFKRSLEAMSTTFYLTNMTPQTDNLNRYIWAYLERDVRSLTNAHGEVWVITGNIFANEDLSAELPIDERAYIGDKVYIPTHCYKAILCKHSDTEFETFAFLMQNIDERIPGEVKDYNISIDRLEEITGLDFFPNLVDQIEKRIESETASVWPIKN